MTAEEIRLTSLRFVNAFKGSCSTDGLIQQSQVIALHEIAAQLAEIKSELRIRNADRPGPGEV